MGKYERREAYEAGRAAAEQDRPAADNPHNRGDGLLRQAWNTGWREVTNERQAKLDKEHAEELEKLRAAVRFEGLGAAEALQPGQTIETVPDPDAVKAHPDSTKDEVKAAELQTDALKGEDVDPDKLAAALKKTGPEPVDNNQDGDPDGSLLPEKKTPAKRPPAKRKPTTKKTGDK